MADEHVKVVREGPVVTVTLDRPGTKNACSMSMWLAIRDAFREIAASDARAAELGFVNAVFPVAELDTRVNEVVEPIASGPPIALSMTKRMLDNAGASSLARALETEAIAQNVNLGTQDMIEAFQAFRENRPPVFQGR